MYNLLNSLIIVKLKAILPTINKMFYLYLCISGGLENCLKYTFLICGLNYDYIFVKPFQNILVI